ncbi:MAG TPA: circularly permuted type 2 ATP-grasp protein [Propionibacteriaceae bacterium]|nr:circularly permuted type 2 ATP-grasp protein [Propionibacteriaceae bacterium]
MTVLTRYLTAAGQPNMFDPAPGFDEFANPDGTVRHGWERLLDGLEEFVDSDLTRAQREVARLLEDDGVTYTTGPAAGVSIIDSEHLVDGTGDLAGALPWKLDPLPLVLDDQQWGSLEVGMVQRAELLNELLADIYGAQKLLRQRRVPLAAVLDHTEYLRALVGVAPVHTPLFMLAADLGRDMDGTWKVMSDRSQAPSGAGFAMQNRRVVSRVMPEVYREAHLHRLTPFFSAMRMALVDAAPSQVENPRVVVLSPGTHSETAFDQAFLASLLGFPLLEGSDLTVRDGRVWMRVLGKLEQVDVILRRVDSTWSDPLELRPGSRLGVSGLTEAVRQRTVSVLNPLGSGILENPALMPYLPELCQHLLGEPLRVPSVQTWWCGDDTSRSHVLTQMESLVIRPISRSAGRSVRGSALTNAQRQELKARISAAPHRYVGQEVLRLSSAPTAAGDRLVRRNVVLRSFTVRQGQSYRAMVGGLARVTDDNDGQRGALVTTPGSGVAKDVWVVGSAPVTTAPLPSFAARLEPVEPTSITSAAYSAAMVPRVLSDLFWFGRYAERAEDLLRLVLATRQVAVETDMDVSTGHSLRILLQAVTHVSACYPGFTDETVEMMPELRSILLDRHRRGTAAHALGGLSNAAQGVRDQLSDDVWMVLADVDRALGTLRSRPHDLGSQLADTSERVLSGLLALSGITSENMVRDPGWHLLDSGRGLERAVQLVTLLRVTQHRARTPAVDQMVMEAVLAASESIVTFRRRYRGRSGLQALLELLVTDGSNPRSVAYQLQRIGTDLNNVPTTQQTSRPLRVLDNLVDSIRSAELRSLVELNEGRRPQLGAFLGGLKDQLHALSDAIRDLYLKQEPGPQPLTRSGVYSGAGE